MEVVLVFSGILGTSLWEIGKKEQGNNEGQNVRRNWMLSCFLLPPLLFSLSLGRDSSPSFSPCLPPPLPPSLAPSLLVGKDSSPKKMGTPYLDLSLISFPHWIWRGRGMGGRPGDSLVPELGKAQRVSVVSIVKLLY